MLGASKEKLVHDYSICGWMVSPIAEVFKDAWDNDSAKHHESMEHLFLQLFEHTANGDQTLLDGMMNVFWSEFEEFVSKQGPFSKTYIWSSEDLQGGKTHLWHKKFSYPNTKWFGQFACHVTSKILGISSAEWNWGEVKHLKTNKCSHLSSDHIKKQATIFGADCAAHAKLE